MLSEGAKSKLLTVGVVGPPILAVVLLGIVSIRSATLDISSANQVHDNLETAKDVQQLVMALQRERGMTCVYLSREPGSPERAMLAEELSGYRQQSDDRALKLCECVFPHTRFESRDHFRSEIQKFRTKIGNTVTECSQALSWYSNTTNHLIGTISKGFLSLSEGSFWSLIQSINSVLSVLDIVGVKRAMGGTFFAAGGFEKTFANVFQKLTGSAEILLANIFAAVPTAETHYSELMDKNAVLMNDLLDMEHTILENNLSDSDTAQGLRWFHNMTSYMGLIVKVERDLTQNVEVKLDEQKGSSWTNFVVVAVICGITGMLCPFLVVMYSSQVNEGKKTEDLLYQMMPKSVAKTLRNHGKVKPENYAAVTIFQSDIFGFSILCADSTPFQMVELLNVLYTKLDEVIQKYDCYKVETSGGAVMIVSGVPQSNGDLHSDHICTMALEMMEMMDKFYIPHKPKDALLLRMGVCTGNCAAGIVGIKTTKYCLFGETVNFVTQLQATAGACRIQLSVSTAEHLSQSHEMKYALTNRGDIKIPGRGVTQTFFLTGKKDMKFSINLEKVPAKVDASHYWQVKKGQLSMTSMDDLL